MNVLIINGSPKVKNSNTYKLTSAFLDGMREKITDIEVRELDVYALDIKPCRGCFACWNKTPGVCVIDDDMNSALKDVLWADLTIWSFPLYYFSVPGALKNFIDRHLPLVLPFMEEKENQTGSGGHASRYDMDDKKTVVISTCGFYTASGNYDGVKSMFDHICGAGNYESVFCGQGELFRVPELSKITGNYLNSIRKAGSEYATAGISKQTRAQLLEPLLPRETFETLADASWGISKDDAKKRTDGSKKGFSAHAFTRQMAALYDKTSYPGKDIIFEIKYTDIGESYQILLGKEGSAVYTDNSLTPTTVIETPLGVWQSIAKDEIRGDEALMQGLYKVTGDFSLMLNWSKYFSVGSHRQDEEQPNEAQKKTNMLAMLLPWIVLWIFPAIDTRIGSFITLAFCATVPLIFYRNKKTVFDVLSNAIVIVLCIIMLIWGAVNIVIPISYLAFGTMWLATCFMRIPLTAYYSLNNYGGEDALKNPMFIKTNRILTGLWGLLYIATSVFTWFLMRTALSEYVGLINTVTPIFMGIFTAWFQKWYPAKIARG